LGENKKPDSEESGSAWDRGGTGTAFALFSASPSSPSRLAPGTFIRRHYDGEGGEGEMASEIHEEFRCDEVSRPAS
jgi:hypothetical protein